TRTAYPSNPFISCPYDSPSSTLSSPLLFTKTSPFTYCFFFFFTATPPTEIYTLSLHDALPISENAARRLVRGGWHPARQHGEDRSEEHTSELQSRGHLVCRLLLEKKKTGYGRRVGWRG